MPEQSYMEYQGLNNLELRQSTRERLNNLKVEYWRVRVNKLTVEYYRVRMN